VDIVYYLYDAVHLRIFTKLKLREGTLSMFGMFYNHLCTNYPTITKKWQQIFTEKKTM